MFMRIDMVTYYPLCHVCCDEMGDQKMVTIHGQQHMRISSQSVKRALRKGFNFIEIPILDIIHRLHDPSISGEESLFLSDKEVEFILLNAFSGDALLKEEISKFYSEHKSGSVVLHVSIAELRMFLEKYKDFLNTISKKKSKKEDSKKLIDTFVGSLSSHSSEEVSLFGRMYAGGKNADVESALSVGHSISLNAVPLVRDFFTARSSTGGPSAITMGDRGLSYGWVYTPIQLDYSTLCNNLFGDNVSLEEKQRKLIDISMRLIIAAYHLYLPTGKSGSAHVGKPDFFAVSFSSNPVNFCDLSSVCIEGNDDIIKLSQYMKANEKHSIDRIGNLISYIPEGSFYKLFIIPPSFGNLEELKTFLTTSLS